MIKHLHFEELPPSASGKTKNWRVRSLGDMIVLGKISWWSHWRKYTFQPEPNTVWDDGCLFEIASFIVEQMDIHKRGQHVV